MSDSGTYGVCIALPEPHAGVVTRWRRRVGDREADRIWPHVTLLPPTRVPAADLEVVCRHLADAAKAASPVTMHLSGTGTFRPVSPVVFLQVGMGLADCELLERAIRSGPLARPLEFPYHPHVTVAHDVDEQALDEAYEGLSGFAARFPVETVSLFERGTDGVWRTSDEFPIGG